MSNKCKSFILNDILNATPSLARYLKQRYENLSIHRTDDSVGCCGGDAIYEIKKGKNLIGIYIRRIGIDGLERAIYEDKIGEGFILSADFYDWRKPKRTDKNKHIPFL